MKIKLNLTPRSIKFLNNNYVDEYYRWFLHLWLLFSFWTIISKDFKPPPIYLFSFHVEKPDSNS